MQSRIGAHRIVRQCFLLDSKLVKQCYGHQMIHAEALSRSFGFMMCSCVCLRAFVHVRACVCVGGWVGVDVGVGVGAGVC